MRAVNDLRTFPHWSVSLVLSEGSAQKYSRHERTCALNSVVIGIASFVVSFPFPAYFRKFYRSVLFFKDEVKQCHYTQIFDVCLVS